MIRADAARHCPEQIMSDEGYKSLLIWQKAMTLCEEVYVMTEAFPSKESYGLTSQMRRAAVSVPSNIAEGRSRQTVGDYRHHLQISRGSVAELETQTLLCIRLKYLAPHAANACLQLCDELSRMLNTLITKNRE
jgi:four helix bundle protein